MTHTPDQPALLPCPFCGGKPFDRGFRRWECSGCGAEGPAGLKAEATEGWNLRAAPSRPDQEAPEPVARPVFMTGGGRLLKAPTLRYIAALETALAEAASPSPAKVEGAAGNLADAIFAVGAFEVDEAEAIARAIKEDRFRIDLAHLTTSRSFTNELGNAIKITIEGPTSLSENILTPLEVDRLRDCLNETAKVEVTREEVAACIGGGSSLTAEDRLDIADAILALFHPAQGGGRP